MLQDDADLAAEEIEDPELDKLIERANEQIALGERANAIEMENYNEPQLIGQRYISEGKTAITAAEEYALAQAQPQAQTQVQTAGAAAPQTTESPFEVLVNDLNIDINATAYFNLMQSMVTYAAAGAGKYINYIAQDVELYTDPKYRADDAPQKAYFNVTVTVIIVVAGTAVFVAGVIATGGGLGFLGAGLMAGGSTAALMGVNDAINGVNTSAEEYAIAITKAVVVALICYGLSKIIQVSPQALKCGFGPALKYSLQRAVIGGALGIAESAISDAIMTGDINGIDWNKAFKSGILQGTIGFISGAIESNLFKGRICFVAGTLVHTQMGLLPIEEIKPGMLVLSKDLETGETEYKPVVRTSYNTADKLAVITAGNGAIIESTPSHPFYDIHSGWMKAEDLTASNQVVDKENNIVPVISVEFLEEEITVYNFEVLEYHNYFVSALGLLVHNVCEGTGSNKLPNVDKVTVDPNKVKNYALDPNHPVGGNKAKVFESSLGYNQSNADQLMKQVQNKLPNSEAILGVKDQYGQRFTVDMQITGPNGNTATVRTGWIIDPGAEIPRMTTIYVK